jgi:hypothetical protein
MKARLAVLITLAALAVAAFSSGNPGTVVNPGDFKIDSFRTALLNDVPGTVVNPGDFKIDSFRTALLNDVPGTVVNPGDFRVDSFRTALATEGSGEIMGAAVVEPVSMPFSA